MTKTTEVDESFIRNVAIPADTETYVAIPHWDIVQAIDKVMKEEAGLTRLMSSFRSAAKGNIITGILSYKGAVEGMGIAVAFVNSYNKTRTLKIGCGSVVWVCENGVLSAEFSITRKHTGTVRNELPLALESLADIALTEHKRNAIQRDEMLRIRLTVRERAEFFGRLVFEEDVLTPVQTSALIKELENTESPFQGNTLWDAYNNVTQILKTTHPAQFLEAHMALHELTREHFNLTA